MTQSQAGETEYVVRPFENGDLAGFLDLYARVFDTDRDREWFDWKYGDNPYVDHVPILLAERDGDLVGARPFFALDVSIDGERELALQPGDTMVHPDHRRQGLFTRMTENAIETYTDDDPAFFFNFPNHRSRPGYTKLGWETVDEQTTYYRIQRPGALGLDESASWTSIARIAAKPVLDGYNWWSDVRADPVDDVTVESFETVPTATLASLAAEGDREGIHVWRDETFYEWRFGNPTWDYVTYVARVDGEPVAGMVVGTSVGPDQTKTQVTDVAPLPDEIPGSGLDALLRRVVEEHADADVLIAPSMLPDASLAKAGFLPDDEPPLSTVSTRTVHVTRSLTDGWTVGGLDIRDRTNWRLTFSEQDSS